ncbi:MAG: hypothetical protein AAFR38_03245 [Planctomycetota bacterium]
MRRSCTPRAILIATIASTLAGCATGPRLTPARETIAPYDTTRGDALWAVAPPANESGVSFVDPLAIGDEVVQAAESVRGIRCVPLNRTIAAMRRLGLERVTSEGEARALAAELGVDAIVAGSISAYDPYDPPVLGLTLVLYASPSAGLVANGDVFDVRLFQLQATDSAFQGLGPRPEAVGGGLFDAKRHDVVNRVQMYAQGRTDIDSPYGWRAFLVRSDLFAEFAAHEAVADLVEQEWLRLTAQAGAE